MNSIFANEKNKAKCQIFTPQQAVETMLDLVGYKTQIVGYTVLENSFGTGNILLSIVKRYILDALTMNIPSTTISKYLERDIYGIEYDTHLFNTCLNNLNNILNEFNLPPVKWKLYNADALTWNYTTKFDFVIGNPPYICYRELSEETRAKIKKKFNTCKNGKFDYYYAFIELGIKQLKDTGKLVQLVPSNLYKNVFAADIRSLLLDHISVILDYPAQNIFENALTSTNIFLYDKNNQSSNILYKNMTSQQVLSISKNALMEKWIFSKSSIQPENFVRFGDIFNASISVATLLNKAFIVTPDTPSFHDFESALLRKAASPRSLRYHHQKYIIFPYKYDKNNKLVRFKSDLFETHFPAVAKHLREYEKDLSKRKKDCNISWFEYGRSQALTHLNQPKLLMSTVITNKVELYNLDANTIPYSGIYITLKNHDFTLNDAARLLRSSEFFNYVQQLGISVSGESIRITCKDINNFKFSWR